MATRQVLKLCENGNNYTVVRHETDNLNPYRVYQTYRAPNKYGIMSQHKKLIAKYADMRSCLYCICDRYAD